MNTRGNVRPNFNTNTMQRQFRYHTINNTNTAEILLVNKGNTIEIQMGPRGIGPCG